MTMAKCMTRGNSGELAVDAKPSAMAITFSI
jgi:hypothetical protein